MSGVTRGFPFWIARTMTPNPVSWLHRLAALLALMIFTGMTVGAHVRSSLAAARGQHVLSELPYQAGYSGLILAAVCCAIVFAIWLGVSEVRNYVKALGAMAVGLLIIFAATSLRTTMLDQGTAGLIIRAGAINVLFMLFCSLAFFTRTDWNWKQSPVADVAKPSLRALLCSTTGLIFVESVLGAGLTVHLLRTPAHVWTGLVTTFAALWVLEIAWNKFAQLTPVKVPCILLAEIVVLQLLLGLVAHSMELNARVSMLPGLPVMAATHAAAAALALAASLFATFQAFKYLAPAKSLEIAVPTADTTAGSRVAEVLRRDLDADPRG